MPIDPKSRSELIWALIRKDARLLRIYLRSAIFTTVACYALFGLFVVIVTNYNDERMQSLTTRVMMTLKSGSVGGFNAVCFFAALLAGSAFTLERSDRSAEFLACLPPTRLQNLISKMIVVLGVTLATFAVHASCLWVAHLLLPYVRAQGVWTEAQIPSPLIAFTFFSATASIIGGAITVSAWLNSNGVPILCGLLTPLLGLSLALLIGWAFNLESEGDAFQTRYANTLLILGLTLIYIGCYWYLTRSEP